MFADDAQLIYDGYLNEEETIERQINEDIVAMKNFLQSLHMKLNEAKTVVTRFATPRQLLRIDPDKTFSLGDCDVVISSESRNLGLIIDTATTFRPHFLKISKECSLTLYHLKAIRSFIPDKQTKLLIGKPNGFEGKGVSVNNHDSSSQQKLSNFYRKLWTTA